MRALYGGYGDDATAGGKEGGYHVDDVNPDPQHSFVRYYYISFRHQLDMLV